MLSPALAVFRQSSSPMALLTADPPFRVVAANTAFTASVPSDGRMDERAFDGRAFADVLAAIDLPTATLDTLRDVARDRAPRTTLQRQQARNRMWQLTVTFISHGSAPLLLCVARDVTSEAELHRRLRDARARVGALTGFARASLSFDAERITEAAVRAAAEVANQGAAVVYLGGATEPLRLAASFGLSKARLPGVPDVLPAGSYPLTRRSLASGTIGVVSHADAAQSSERVLMRNLGMMLMAILPLRSPFEAFGVMLAMYRAARRNVVPEEMQMFEACADQLALAFEHARLYAEVEKERAELALVLDQIPDAVVIADRNGRIAHANPAAARLFGADALADDAAMPGHASPPSAFAELGLTAALEGETVRGVPGVVRTGSGEPARIIASAAALKTPTGERHGAVAVATDVTALRRAEEALRMLADTSATLGASLEVGGTLPILARQLVPGLADLCAIDLHENGVATRAGVAYLGTIDPDTAALLERCTWPVDGRSDPAVVGPVLAERVRHDTLDALTPDPDHRRLLRELDLQSFMLVPIAARGRRSGLLWLATAASGRRYTPDDLALAGDLARRIATAVDNGRLFAEVQRADRLKDEFLAMLSHELRTPLAPVMAWLQILKRGPDPAHVRSAMEVIERNVRLQAKLIDDLLDLSAITRGKITLERTPHDLRSTVEAAVETVRPTALAKSQTLRWRLPDDPLVIEGDPGRLQQVVWNLLANAVKFSPERGSIVVELVREGDTAVLHVRDQGIGIDAGFLPQIFDMFEQQDHGNRRRYGGLGIGLALARRITELHRGTIEARSDGLGRGAEFYVRLPIVAGNGTSPGRAAGSTLEGRAVLVVDDAPDTRDAAHLMLEHAGIRVVDAAEGHEALAKLDEGTVDVVLCDLRMPLMDGFELIRRIRADPRHRALPVIAVSGFAAHDDEQRTRAAGFDAYIRKPFVESTLIAAVERAIHEQRRAPEG